MQSTMDEPPEGRPAVTPSELLYLGLQPTAFPSYMIENRLFDFYRPQVRQVALACDYLACQVEERWIRRFVLHLGNTPLTPEDFARELDADPIALLNELMFLKDDEPIVHYVPGQGLSVDEERPQ